MAKAKRKRTLSRSPQSVHEDAWYYEAPKGLDVHVWIKPERALSKDEPYHVNVQIPWRLIRATVKRMPLKRKPALKTRGGE